MVAKFFLSIAVITVAGLVGLTVCASMETLWWRAYLVAQFRIQIAIASIIVMAALVAHKRTRILGAIAFSIAVINSIYFLPIYLPKMPSTSHSSQALSLLIINLNNRNERYTDVLNYIEREEPDVLLLSELTPVWKTAMESLGQYDHVVAEERLDTYGIAVYSKLPLMNPSIKYYGTTGHPTVVCTINRFSKPITLVHTHIQGPIKKDGFEQQKEQMIVMAKELKSLPRPMILTGDTNSTPWTYLLANLIRDNNLVDSRQGFGLQLSWPAPGYWRNVPFTLIPIDHCFVSPDFSVEERKVGPFIGSDHAPIWIKLGQNGV